MIRLLIFLALCVSAIAQPLTVNDTAFVGSLTISSASDTPPNVAGLYARWEADSLPYSNGASVSNWVDKVSSISLLSSGTSMPIWTNGNSKINNKPFLAFDSTDDWLTNKGFFCTNSSRIFILGQIKNTTATNRYIVDSFNATRSFIYLDNLNEMSIGWGTTINGYNAPNNQTNWWLFEFLMQGSTSDTMTNGVPNRSAPGNAGAQALRDISLGARFSDTAPSGLDIAAMLVWTNSLVTNDLVTIRQWFKGKYGIPPNY